jgi:hypothetical protein
VRRALLFAFAATCAARLACACDSDGAIDTISDASVDPAVWRADGQKISSALPRVVASFKPSEGADAFATSYRTGPVFGGSCTYADGARQLVVRVESGNIRARAATLAKGHANPGESFVTHDATVHGGRATVHWNGIGKTAEVVFLLQRRLLVQMVLVPAKGEEEIVQLAESMDVAPLQALAFDGVNH